MYRNQPEDSPRDPGVARAPAYTPARGRTRRVGATAALSLALVSGALGGGAIGSIAATKWADSPRATVVTTAAQPSNPQTLQTGAQTSAASVASSVYQKAGPAVVEVTVSGAARRGLTPAGGGSGFVVDAKGLILTNNHVVEGARSVSVRFASGESREARVLGTDRGNDLALLKVDLPRDVPVANLGNSDAVQVGETAIAIGSPFGLEGSVTQGIVSAVDRDWQGGGGRTQRDLIQTDAPINPGNSGGPLLNARGEVIGIATFNESPVRGSVGVGFATPVNRAKELLPRLEAGAQLQPAWMGIAGAELDATIARDQGLSVREGVLVTDVVPGGPAERAGIRGGQDAGESIPRGGDVIVAIDGARVRDMSELADRIAGHQPGERIRITVVRDGQEREVTVTLGEWPESTP